jgi:predicted ATPase
MDVPRIVITGAPASAKTEFIERLKSNHEFAHFEFLEELARKLLNQNAGYRRDPIEFHCHIYDFQVEREEELQGRPFITDRGTVDGFAFHPGSLKTIGTSLDREYQRYTGVIQLGSAAKLGRQYYKRDEIRSESLDEALKIEKAISKVWQGHKGYKYIEPCANIERKFDKFVQLVRIAALL